ncbi:MAG: START-like domain-containing protein [Paludibacteraceae bacterium]|nr:START-like domain-containing protein [Paludibacteraceae bacterium]
MAKEKFQLEYNLKSVSLNLLWTSLSTSSGLEEWFADRVIVNGKKYIFKWSDNEQEAELVTIRVGSFIRFRWLEDITEKCYFEFKITIDELTEELALVITDFAAPEDMKDAKELWNKQIRDLFRSIGI